jgi:hypothetical protein
MTRVHSLFYCHRKRILLYEEALLPQEVALTIAEPFIKILLATSQNPEIKLFLS